MLLWLLAGLGLAVALKKPKTIRSTKGPPGSIAGKKIAIKGKKLPITGKDLEEEEPQWPGGYAGPVVNVSVEGGWTPVWFHVAEDYDLEWGACFYQWQKDLAQQFGDTNAQKKIIGAMGRIMDFIIAEANPVIKFIINRVCFRVTMPALKVHITGALGSLQLIGPAIPRGLERTLADGTVVPGTGLNNAGGTTIEGYNPANTRPGFNAVWGKWPLQWPPPEGKLGGAWLRNLGDIAGVGSNVYQMITAQDGEEKSWPMMTKTGWRSMFRLGGDFVLLSVLDSKGNVSNRAAMDLFDTWAPEGSRGLQKGAATKTKADNRYK